MSNIEPCVFCGGEEVKVTRRTRKDSKYFFVECEHCDARGSSYGAIKNLNGEFEETDEELIANAIDTWNKAGRPSWWARVKKRWNQLFYELSLFKEKFQK